ncbi:MAG: hypothetical protein ACOYMR_08735, partial [Ilumatobacteraceae bacterium]
MTELPFRVLVLCAHNRTRSVMAAALLRQHLGDDGRFVVETAGFNEEGLPALPEAVTMLREHGMDASDHRSRRCTPEMARAADLVLTADKKQVLAVVGDLGGDFAKTFTMPEFVHRQNFPDEQRPHGFAYISSSVAEVEDPTGRMPSVWKNVYANLDLTTRAVAT